MKNDDEKRDEFMRNLIEHISHELNMSEDEVMNNLGIIAVPVGVGQDGQMQQFEKQCGHCELQNVCNNLEKAINHTKQNMILRDIIKLTPGITFEEARKESVEIATQIMNHLVSYKGSCFYNNVFNFLSENVNMILTTKNIDSIFSGRAFIIKIQNVIDQTLVNDATDEEEY